MEPWNREILEWDLRGGTNGIDTKLPVVDIRNKIQKGNKQKLLRIRAVSQPERHGKVEIYLYPSVHLFSHAGEDHIFKHFTNLLDESRDVEISRGVWGDGAWPPLIIKLKLGEMESFCDTAVRLVKVILKRVGVKDERGYILGNFTHNQASFIKFENMWISHVRWLRIKHQLPFDYVQDYKNIPLVEEGDLS